ncbi:MAG: succinylglutamate desuccinylase/aspartoacylase family protein [Thioalkalivibrionaceae bacterium]
MIDIGSLEFYGRRALATSAPSVLVLGAVHGNETCGTQAIRRVQAELESGALALARGRLTMAPVTNPLAYRQRTRIGERNLNRNFRETDVPEDYEDRIVNVLAPVLREHDVLLDLHSFHTGGQPFIMLGPENNAGVLEPFSRAEQESAWALRVGAKRLVEGWLATYAEGVRRRMANPRAERRAQMLSTDPSYGIGTTEYARARGAIALTVECGQHDDPRAPDVAYAAICNTLAHFRLIDAPEVTPVDEYELIRLVEVVDRDDAEDTFVREWASFDRLTKGEEIGRRADGTSVCAPADGFVVFPNPNAVPGNEWFYRAEVSPRVLSA